MTTEEKAKRYDEAFERAKVMHEEGMMTERLEYLFPELAESEDEKNIKDLIDELKCSLRAANCQNEACNGGHEKRIALLKWAIAWLEQQSKQKPIEINHSPYNPDEYESYEDGNATGLRKKQKPVDKVEPKFKVGNWYQCTKDFFGKGVTFDKNTAYYCAKEGCLQCEYGCHIAIVKDLYDNFKLWTIQDAKDGDVLTDGNLPFIFKKIDTNKYCYAYCGISVDDGFKIESDGESGEWTWMQDIKPATKEQRDLLFQKMHEAGYEWDAEKKELKKIEQKSAWSEEDEKILNSLIISLARIGASTRTDSTSINYTFSKEIDWLKSIKQRMGK